MPFITDDLFNDICAANDIVEYASSFMTLKRSGREYMACCPFHNEKTPSFHIDREKQLFHCFGCGASGNFVQLVMRLEGLGFNDAIKQLADRAGIVIPEKGIRQSNELTQRKESIFEMNRIAGRFFYDRLMDKEQGRNARTYFASRKLSRHTIIKFGLGYAPDSPDMLTKLMHEKGYKDELIIDAGLAVERNGKTVDKFRNRVMFPIINARGKVIGFGGRVLGNEKFSNGFKLAKYLNSPQNIVFDKGANLFALNLAKMSKERDIILCEGYMDVITVHQAGINNCVATLGTAITEQQAKLMLRYGEEILICYDMDEAGTKAALRAIDVISAAGGKSRVIRIKGAKDPDEYISKYGVSGFKQAIEKAVSSTDFKISLIKKKYDLTDTDGKIRFLEEAAKVVANLADPVETEAYIKRIAFDTGISEQSILGKCNEIKSKTRRAKSPIRTREEYKKKEVSIVNRTKERGEKITNTVLEAEKRLLLLISQSKRLSIKAADLLSPEDFSNDVYKVLAEQIFTCVKEGTQVDAAVILNEFSGNSAAENMAAAVFFNNEVYSDDDRTLFDLIYTIKKNKIDARMKATNDPMVILELITMGEQLEKEHNSGALRNDMED